MYPGISNRSVLRLEVGVFTFCVKWPWKHLKPAFLLSLEETLVFCLRRLWAVHSWFLCLTLSHYI